MMRLESVCGEECIVCRGNYHVCLGLGGLVCYIVGIKCMPRGIYRTINLVYKRCSMQLDRDQIVNSTPHTLLSAKQNNVSTSQPFTRHFSFFSLLFLSLLSPLLQNNAKVLAL